MTMKAPNLHFYPHSPHTRFPRPISTGQKMLSLFPSSTSHPATSPSCVQTHATHFPPFVDANHRDGLFLCSFLRSLALGIENQNGLLLMVLLLLTDTPSE